MEDRGGDIIIPKLIHGSHSHYSAYNLCYKFRVPESIMLSPLSRPDPGGGSVGDASIGAIGGGRGGDVEGA